MKITGVSGREIFDSRGFPTLECQLELEDGSIVIASVPAGASKGTNEALEMREGGERLFGLGVSKAITILEEKIAPMLIGKHPDVVETDLALLEADGTVHKSNFGGNTMLATSIAVARAQAHVEQMPLYELIAVLCDYDAVSVPFPLFNFINGGLHADNNFPIQEILVIPVGDSTFRSCMESAIYLFYTFKKILQSHGKRTLVGDEGGFAPLFKNEEEALTLLVDAMKIAKLEKDFDYFLAMDVAATQLYDPQTKKYNWSGKQLTNVQLIDKYEKIMEKFPMYALEDAMAEFDEEGWHLLNERLKDSTRIVADDLTASNPELINKAIQQDIANTFIIKPNQIGTVTQVLQAISMCKEKDYGIIVSHRSGETNDTFIADLAVGVSAGHIKAGGPTRGERMAKYNHLLRIEDTLMLQLLGAAL